MLAKYAKLLINKFQYRSLNIFLKSARCKNFFELSTSTILHGKYDFRNRYFLLPTSIFVIALLSPAYNEADKELDTSNSTKNLVLHDLNKVLLSDQIETNAGECAIRGKPWNSYHKSPNNPSIIVFPRTTEEVSKILKICHQHKFPVIPFGGGTSIEGQTLALTGGISIDFNEMKSIIQFNKSDLDCVVQAGLGYIELNDYLRPFGYWFPLDPGPGASIGGMCACRCSGSTALRYGSMRENVLHLTAVMADGTIIKTGSRARKSSAGYDLTRLLIGSEGTLGVITEIALKVHTIPPYSYALRVSFDTIGEAAAVAREATVSIGTGSIGRIELLDKEMVTIINTTTSTTDTPPWPALPTLMFEITGTTINSVTEQLQLLNNLVQQRNGKHIQLATDPVECKKLWMVRKECLWSAMSAYPNREAMITDVCVPLSKLAEIISSTRVACDASSPKLPSPIVAHAGDGNFHVLIMLNPNDPAEVAEAHRLAHHMAANAIALDGTCTGEHGVGVGKMDLLRHEMGPGSMSVMEAIKTTLDPNLILNPGKVVLINSGQKTSDQISKTTIKFCS